MFTRDKEFEEALASPEALESYLGKLTKQRRVSWAVMGLSTAVCFFIIFVMIWGSFKDPAHNPAVMVAVALTMLLGTIQHTTSALSAQADIRTLQAHRKTLELLGSRKDQP